MKLEEQLQEKRLVLKLLTSHIPPFRQGFGEHGDGELFLMIVEPLTQSPW
jgi:hypothetical protein